MSKLVLFIFFVFISLYLVNTTTANDDETVIPDFSKVYTGKTYSGYLNLKTPGKFLHYLYQPSSRDQTKDPLVLWLNGGPGCSSMLGWAQEHGPAILGNDLNWSANPYSWNTVANMIYLESPAGVGFSYVTNPDDIKSNDLLSAQENLEALLEWFVRYPELKQNDFYIAGESYAGIYVPTLASYILDYNSKKAVADQIKLKGILVGNGVTDWREQSEAIYDFAFTHALHSIETRDKYVKYCKTEFDEAPCNVIKADIQHLLEGVNLYDIYKMCYSENNSKVNKDNVEVEKLRDLKSNTISYSFPYTPWLFRNIKEKGNNTNNNVGLTPPCIDGKGANYFFNRADVKTALHVKTDIVFGICSEEVGRDYTSDYNRGSLYLYPKLINAKLRILIFSGDTDGAVPTNGTLNWITNFNLPVLKPWRSWFVNKEVAGYTANYQGLDFVSVKGVGHMVPEWARPQALHMFTNYLLGQDM